MFFSQTHRKKLNDDFFYMMSIFFSLSSLGVRAEALPHHSEEGTLFYPKHLPLVKNLGSSGNLRPSLRSDPESDGYHRRKQDATDNLKFPKGNPCKLTQIFTYEADNCEYYIIQYKNLINNMKYLQ